MAQRGKQLLSVVMDTPTQPVVPHACCPSPWCVSFSMHSVTENFLCICRSCRQALHKRKLRTMTGPLLQAQHSSTAAAATCAPACFNSEASDCALHMHLQQQAQLLHLQQQQAAAAAELQQIQTQQQQMLVPAHSMGSGQASAQLATLVAAAEQAQAMLAAVRAQVSARQQLAAPGMHSPDAVMSDNSSRTASPQGAAASLAAAAPVAEDCPAGDTQASFTAATGADADAGADTDFESFLEALLTGDVPACNFQAPASGLSGSSGQSTYLPASLTPFGPAASLTAPTPGFAGTPLPCAQVAPCVGSGLAGLGAASGMLAATSSGSTGGVVGPGWNAAAHCGAVQQLESLNEMLQQVHSRVLAIMQTSQAGAATYY